MTKFDVKFTPDPHYGWEAEGVFDNESFLLYAPNLPGCLRAVATKVASLSGRRTPMTNEVVYNDR